MQSETIAGTECITKQTKSIDHNIHHDIAGIPVCRRAFDGYVIRSGLAYEARPGDVFIVTMPRSGTTWMETIVYSVLQKGRAFDDDFDDFFARTPFLERHGSQGIEAMRRPGSIKTHLPFNMIPQHREAKYICVVRNPKDMCISFHEFLRKIPGVAHSDVSFEIYFNLFLDGRVTYGDYFDHLLQSWSHKDDPNVLFIVYEDMKKDVRPMIRRVADFLGVELTDELLERIATITSFDYLKKAQYNEKLSQKIAVHGLHPRQVVHKGVVGEWRKIMSEEQSRRLEARFREATQNVQCLSTLWDEYKVFENK